MVSVPAPDGVALATSVHLPDRGPAPIVVTRTPYGRRAFDAEARGWVRHGFGFVCQDVRGRYDSPGEWTPYSSCERLDGGSLAAWVRSQPWCSALFASGASYGAFTAWEMAAAAPGLVDGVMSLVPAMGMRAVKFEPGGPLRLAEHVSWWMEYGDARESRTGYAASTFADRPDLLARLPVTSIECGVDLPSLWNVLDAVDSAPVTPALPSLHIGGLRDLLLPMTLHQWESARCGSLILGPWGHELAPLGARQIAWMRSVLSGTPSCAAESTSTGVPRTVAWPPPVAQRWLRVVVDATYVNDPLRPFPGRSNVVRVSLPVSPGWELAGVPVVSLEAESDAVSVDWIVRLVERTPSDPAVEIARGLAVDDPAEITLTPVHHVLSPGSTLELEVSSSDFPRLARNLGAGADRYTTTSTVVSRQHVRSVEVRLPLVEKEDGWND